jgi:RNA polymerase sigma-70 factor (ECF subfamily)
MSQTVYDTNIRLMLAVQGDDASAFEELMFRFQGRVQSLFRHLVGNREMAEDLTQDVFLRVFRARKSYQPQAKFSTWLFTIANNVAFNQLRSLRRKPEIQFGGQFVGQFGGEANETYSELASNPAEAMMAGSEFMPARQLDKVELREMVRLAIEALNDRQRMAVLLNRFEGMNYTEIADVMQSTPQAIKSLLCRAHIQLRNLLQRYVQKGNAVDSTEDGEKSVADGGRQS